MNGQLRSAVIGLASPPSLGALGQASYREFRLAARALEASTPVHG
jgi:hypothetical protein